MSRQAVPAPKGTLALPWRRGDHEGQPAIAAELPWGLAFYIQLRRARANGARLRYIWCYKPGRYRTKYVATSRAGARRVIRAEAAMAGYDLVG